jgi:hypothetical protein
MTEMHVLPGRAVFIRTDANHGLVVGTGSDLNPAIITTTECPRCGSAMANLCVTASGQRASRVHAARFHAFWGPDAEPLVLEDDD